LASVHQRLTAAGALVVGISVDAPERNAAMVEKLRLPFPLLADGGGEGAIKPYGLWNPEEHGGIAVPAVVLVEPDGEEVFRHVARDYADRLGEEELLARVEALGLPAVEQEPPRPGEAESGPRAMPARALSPYFRGAKFAAVALQRRVPEAEAEARALRAEMDRYLEALPRLKD
jgi:hypothetical protein